MALSAFTDKNHQPSEEELRFTLAEAHPAWVQFLEHATSRVSPLSPISGFTSASTGWGLRLRCRERVIVYMTPGQGKFLVSFALGEKAAAAAHAARLSDSILKAIDAAPRDAEGRGVRFEVRHAHEVAPLAVLAQIKSEN